MTLYKTAEAAKQLGLHPATVYQLVATGKLHCCRIGPRQGAIRITQEQIDDYLRSADTTPEAVEPKARTQTLKLKHLHV